MWNFICFLVSFLFIFNKWMFIALQLAARQEQPVLDGSKYTSADVQIVSSIWLKKFNFLNSISFIMYLSLKNLYLVKVVVLICCLFQMNQKVRACDICGAFLSVYDRYFLLVMPFTLVFVFGNSLGKPQWI